MRQRRSDALSRERIVEVAIDVLDRDGEAGLTFRRLALTLKTGPGALYHHVANREELLAAAADAVLTTASIAGAGESPRDAVRAIAGAVFDAIDAHPWVGRQLVPAPAQPAMLAVFERIGQQVRALGVPDAALFTSASALTNYMIGVGELNAANALAAQGDTDRTAALTQMSDQWANLDAHAYPMTRLMAGQMRDHDDREQFLDGIDLILAGIAAR
jgi:AcrR family transcriptional regulator